MQAALASPPLPRGGTRVTCRAVCVSTRRRSRPTCWRPQSGELGLARAFPAISGVARDTGIASTTLHYRVKGRPQPGGARRTVFAAVGHPARLPEDAELELAELVCQAEEALVPLPNVLLQQHARELYAAINGLALASVPDTWFGKHWRAAWKKRMSAHGFEFSLRSVQQLDAARAAALTPEVAKATYELWERVVRTGNRGGAFSPACIWIMDEIGCGGKGRQYRRVARAS